MADRPLTKKQEAFALYYAETGNATQSYRRAFGTQAPDTSVNPRASNMLKKPHVKEYLATLRGKVADKIDAKIDKIADRISEAADRPLKSIADIAMMLIEDRRLAHTTEDARAATEATMSLAKLLGHYVEKKNVTSDNTNTNVNATVPVSAFDEFIAEAEGAGAEGDSPKPLPN